MDKCMDSQTAHTLIHSPAFIVGYPQYPQPLLRLPHFYSLTDDDDDFIQRKNAIQSECCVYKRLNKK